MSSTEAAIDANAPGPSSAYRWVVLVVISLAMFANYYVYDSVAPIASELKKNLNFTDSDIGRLYSFYSWAAIIALIGGGILIDKFGTVKTTIAFGATAALSAVIMSLTSNMWVMIGSRFMLGLGSEPLIVAVTCALAKWFKGKELGFAFGINLTIARLGSVVADKSPGWFPELFVSWELPLTVAAGIGLLCVIAPIFYGLLERNAAKRYGLGKAGETDKLVWSDLFKFGASFWFVVLLCVTFYSAIFPFRSFAIKFFEEAYGMVKGDAGNMNSWLPVSALVATPVFGILADKFGKRSLFMAFGAFLLMPVYVLMAYKIVPLAVPIAMMGIAFSLIPAVMWPSVAYLVNEKRLGSAYAIMTLIQQVGVGGMNELIGYTNDRFQAGALNPGGYAPGMWMFSSLGFLALLFAVLLRKSETGPNAKGLETITTSSGDLN